MFLMLIAWIGVLINILALVLNYIARNDILIPVNIICAVYCLVVAGELNDV